MRYMVMLNLPPAKRPQTSCWNNGSWYAEGMAFEILHTTKFDFRDKMETS